MLPFGNIKRQAQTTVVSPLQLATLANAHLRAAKRGRSKTGGVPTKGRARAVRDCKTWPADAVRLKAASPGCTDTNSRCGRPPNLCPVGLQRFPALRSSQFREDKRVASPSHRGPAIAVGHVGPLALGGREHVAGQRPAAASSTGQARAVKDCIVGAPASGCAFHHPTSDTLRPSSTAPAVVFPATATAWCACPSLHPSAKAALALPALRRGQ